ncbi:uncharacterized protein PV09_09749 [Verruconis gallopava]|uniref:Uncharacterized protein n=1 Tax=Verruconis gallopava TaxID=253628 RepID=A0A0D1ZWN8_9PEZI|nr:uncharacterized protein PV09_09749 [Verruconis gallopava]KIV98434.1 hypothetical protein PV09_09749 [Verruconis gallopava]
MTTELETIIRAMQVQMTALQEALARQNQVVFTLSEEIAALKSPPGSPPSTTYTAPNTSDL